MGWNRIEQNESTGFMSPMSLSPSYVLLCNSLALRGIEPIPGGHLNLT